MMSHDGIIYCSHNENLFKYKVTSMVVDMEITEQICGVVPFGVEFETSRIELHSRSENIVESQTKVIEKIIIIGLQQQAYYKKYDKTCEVIDFRLFEKTFNN